MHKSATQLFKNTVVIAAAEVVSKIMTFVFFIFTARVLGVNAFGDFSYTLALMMVVSIVSDFGASSFLVKVSAQDSERAKDFSVATLFRMFVTLLANIVVLVYLHISHASQEVITLAMCMGGGMLLSCYGQNIGFVFRGRNKVAIDGFIRLLHPFLASLTGVLALKLGYGLTGVGVTYLIAFAATSAAAFAINLRFGLAKFTFSLSWTDYQHVIRESLPYFIWAGLSIIYAKFDTILLQHVRGPQDVGVFSAALRVTEIVTALPAIIFMAVLPVLSSAIAKKDMETAAFISHFTLKYMTYLGMFITCCIFLTADFAINTLYNSSEYAGAILPLRVLIISSAISYIYIIPLTLFFIAAPPRVISWYSLVTPTLLVGLDLVIIPIWGFVGASAVRVVTEIVGLIMLSTYVNRTILKLAYRDFLLPAAVASLVTGVSILMARSFLLVPAYLAIYVSALFICKGFSKDEFSKIRTMVSSSFTNW